MKDIPELTGKDLGLKTVRGKLLTSKEIANFLRKSERWVHMKTADGTFPFKWYPIGWRGRAVDSADLDDWLSAVEIQAGKAPVPEKKKKRR